jgi:hypothetical protein
MEQGFTLTGRDTYRRAASWVAGPPKQYWLLGLKLPHPPIEIQAWRCGRCGFLENYAKG